MKKIALAIWAVTFSVLCVSALGQQVQVAPGMRLKTKGVVIKRNSDGFILRDQAGSELQVRLSTITKIEEKKSNPFRSAKKYSPSQLVRGLNVEVEGRGDTSGALMAEKVRFSDSDLKFALTVESQVVPIEQRIGSAEERLARAESAAERLSGQVEELTEAANLARGGAKAAQETADAAVEGVNKTNERISALDEYEVRKSVIISFRVGSALLLPEAKAKLDQIAAEAKSERGFLIEVRGFASADGPESMNRRLSQRRAEAVVRYLAEKHDIPLRRIILPFGYGEAMPIADNSTREGRQQNRRAEVRILINRGLTTPVSVGGSRSASAKN
jgi:outer membrane protein OmpA-like peptidoglycan-associated protein